MRKGTIPLLAMFASSFTYAAPPVIPTDLLAEDETYVGASLYSTTASMSGTYNTSSGVVNLDGSGSANLSSLGFIYGFSNATTIELSLPYTIQDEGTITMSDGLNYVDITSSNEGLADLSATFTTQLSDKNNQRIVAIAKVKFPLGDDNPGQSEYIENGQKTQSLKTGGAGSGTTDFGFGAAWSSYKTRTQPFAEAYYLVSGSKTEDGEKESPGNKKSLSVGFKRLIDYHSSISFVGGIEQTETGKSGEDNLSSYETTVIGIQYQNDIDKHISLSGMMGYISYSDLKFTYAATGNTMTLSQDGRIFGFRIDYLL